MSDSPRTNPAEAADLLAQGVGRRTLLRASAGLLAAGAVSSTATKAAALTTASHGPVNILQPGVGPMVGTYVPARPDQILWGHLPIATTPPILTVNSGAVLTIDAVSHEGILEDQGKDPVEFFGYRGVPRDHILKDAIEIARTRERIGPGPHVVTGPIHLRGAEVGDVLKVEVLDIKLRVPYGVVSSRHGKGALPDIYPDAWEDDPRYRKYFNQGGNVSVFTPVRTRNGELVGVMPGSNRPRFPLNSFMGIMGVARNTTGMVDSVPPTDTGGNMDVNDFGMGSTVYLPIRVPGAKFFIGDPHHAQGDGEVALTAMEGSMRGTFRLTVIKPGGRAPKIAFSYPFGETADHWIPIGLSDPDGNRNGNITDLDTAMRKAVMNALQFLTEEMGMDAPVAYTYLSAAVDFQVSQVVDRTKGIHALIRKSDFERW